MNVLRPACFILLSVIAVFLWPAASVTTPATRLDRELSIGYAVAESGVPRVHLVQTPTDGGIRLTVPHKYRPRFEKWKAELLSSPYGQRLWDEYASNKQFILKIIVTADRKHGAGTDDFEWDPSGLLVGATITLGSEIHGGFPNPIYYPVLNSLDTRTNSPFVNGSIVAAAKISHEFGHVRQIGQSKMSLLQTQSRLIPVYISIFRKNGLKTDDPKLIEIVSEMGGTPVGIWEAREYRSEVSAMIFLHDRIRNEPYYCSVFNRVRRNLESYAPLYAAEFDEYPEFRATACRNGSYVGRKVGIPAQAQ